MGPLPQQHLLEQAVHPDPALRPSAGHRSPSSLENAAAAACFRAGASSMRRRSCSPSLAQKKSSHKTNHECSRSWGDSSASPKSSGWRGTGSSTQDGAAPSREGRNPVLSTLALATRCLLSLVLIGAIPVTTMFVTSAYQASVDLLCISVPSLLLVQDFARLAPSVAS